MAMYTDQVDITTITMSPRARRPMTAVMMTAAEGSRTERLKGRIAPYPFEVKRWNYARIPLKRLVDSPFHLSQDPEIPQFRTRSQGKPPTPEAYTIPCTEVVFGR